VVFEEDSGVACSLDQEKKRPVTVKITTVMVRLMKTLISRQTLSIVGLVEICVS
jgi:hypothetical protein